MNDRSQPRRQMHGAIARRRREALAALVVVCVCLAASGDAQATENDAGAWLITSASGSIPAGGERRPWRYATDIQYRWVDNQLGFQQTVLRPSIGYTLASGVQLWLGYGRFDTDLDGRRAGSEDRYWQQANWRVSRWESGAALSARVRIEERELSTGDDIAVVSRLLLRYQRPFAPGTGQYWAVAVEPFIDFRDTDWGANRGLSQNRLILAWGQRLSEHFTLEAGYMNQFFFREDAPDRSNHLGILHLRMSFK